jgi:hypothetical protein
MPVKRTIIVWGEGTRREYPAASAISPGDYVVINSSGAALRLGTAKLRGQNMFAIENEVFGKGVEVDYAANDRVLCEAVHSGMMVNVTIAAAATAIVIGDSLEAAADGTLRKFTDGVIIAVAEEAVDNSGGASKTRVRARIV